MHLGDLSFMAWGAGGLDYFLGVFGLGFRVFCATVVFFFLFGGGGVGVLFGCLFCFFGGVFLVF